MKEGPGLIPEEVTTALKMAACELYLAKQEYGRIETPYCEGFIETAWKEYLYGTRSGVFFEAHIDAVDGTTYRINFLFSEEDLKRGKEILAGTLGSMTYYTREDLATIPSAMKQFRNLQAGGSTKLN
jgi:hypothetical protein